jgi:multiple sugar transport system permease protein
MTTLPKMERVETQPPQRSSLTEFFYQLRTLRSQKWGNLWGYVFVAPAMILYFVFQAWPIFRGLFMSFSDYRWIIPETHGWSSFNGLANYREMASDETFWRSLGIAFKYTIFFIPATLVLALFVAVMISKVKNPALAGFYRVVSYLPVILPVSVAMVVWRSIYHNEFGYLNYFLESAVGVEEPPNWLGSAQWALVSVLIASIWMSFGHQALLFLIGIYNINTEQYEAAAIDGAGGWQQFRYITLPGLRPIFVIVLVLSAGVLGTTVEMMVLFTTGGGPAESVLTTGLYIYRTAFEVGDMRMGYAAGMSLILGLIGMVISAVIFRLLRTERA